LNLVYLCESFGLPEVASFWQQVVDMNECRKERFANGIIDAMFRTVNRKKICILGFAFKKNTGDTRDTPAISVCGRLMSDGALLSVYDPKVSRDQALQEFSDYDLLNAPTGMSYDLERQFLFVKDVEEAVRDAHCIVVLTEWDEFITLPFDRFYAIMQKPAFIFDGRNILDHAALFALGFDVHSIGRRPLCHQAGWL